MAEELLTVEITEHARFAYSSMGPQDRRILDAWFDHLRNWRNDEFIRSRSKRVSANEEMYVFQTSTDIVIVFRIDGSRVSVLSIYRAEALRAFEPATEQGAP